MELEVMLTPWDKFPLQEAQRKIESTPLHHVGQRIQHTTNWAIPAAAPDTIGSVSGLLDPVSIYRKIASLISSFYLSVAAP